MPSYWDRLAETYTQIGEARFWLKHRLRITEGLSGRVLEACCGGGQLVIELLQRDVDAYGIDLAPQMVERARGKLVEAGFDPQRVARADVTRLPFADGTFDTVLSTGAIGLFQRPAQRAAVGELARVARREVRLLESFEKQEGLYLGRVLAFMFDGMKPIPQQVFRACGLDCTEEWDIFGGAFSYVRCVKAQGEAT
jgi:ubiquinone/menaquinone biosynthesis C-methylase UbiE